MAEITPSQQTNKGSLTRSCHTAQNEARYPRNPLVQKNTFIEQFEAQLRYLNRRLSESAGGLMLRVPQSHKTLLADENQACAFLATIMPDGSPQLSARWFNSDGKHILFNTGKQRGNYENIRRDARVAVAIHDPKNPYRYIQLRGKIVERPRGGPRRTRINLRGNTAAKTLSCARAYPVSSTR